MGLRTGEVVAIILGATVFLLLLALMCIGVLWEETQLDVWRVDNTTVVDNRSDPTAPLPLLPAQSAMAPGVSVARPRRKAPQVTYVRPLDSGRGAEEGRKEK